MCRNSFAVNWKTLLISIFVSALVSVLCCAMLIPAMLRKPEAGGLGIDNGAEHASFENGPEQEAGSDRSEILSGTGLIDDDAGPVDALFLLLMSGDPEYAKEAFHPESLARIEKALERIPGVFRKSGTLVGSLRGAILSRIVSGLDITADASYVITERTEIEGPELNAIIQRYSRSGYAALPEKARKLTIRVSLKTKAGECITELSPTVVKVGESWYLDITELEDQTSFDIASRILRTTVSLASTTPLRLDEYGAMILV